MHESTVSRVTTSQVRPHAAGHLRAQVLLQQRHLAHQRRGPRVAGREVEDQGAGRRRGRRSARTPTRRSSSCSRRAASTSPAAPSRSTASSSASWLEQAQASVLAPLFRGNLLVAVLRRRRATVPHLWRWRFELQDRTRARRWRWEQCAARVLGREHALPIRERHVRTLVRHLAREADRLARHRSLEHRVRAQSCPHRGRAPRRASALRVHDCGQGRRTTAALPRELHPRRRRRQGARLLRVDVRRLRSSRKRSSRSKPRKRSSRGSLRSLVTRSSASMPNANSASSTPALKRSTATARLRSSAETCSCSARRFRDGTRPGSLNP